MIQVNSFDLKVELSLVNLRIIILLGKSLGVWIIFVEIERCTNSYIGLAPRLWRYSIESQKRLSHSFGYNSWGTCISIFRSFDLTRCGVGYGINGTSERL